MKEKLLQLTRKIIEEFVKNGKIYEINEDLEKEFFENKGVFISIYKIDNSKKVLRGCMGRPYPDKPLIKNLIEAAIDSTMDPRFLPLSEDELKDIMIEVSILTKPEEIKVNDPKEYLNLIEQGKDGLIIERNGRAALFLPQVWEYFSSKIEFLSNLCLKAGLSSNDWLKKDCKIYKFNAEVISEENFPDLNKK